MCVIVGGRACVCLHACVHACEREGHVWQCVCDVPQGVEVCFRVRACVCVCVCVCV